MRVSSLIVLVTLIAVGAVLAGTVVLERGLSWLLEENELPVHLEWTPTPNIISKYMIWIQQLVRTPSASADQCKVYIAESTIPGAGMGLYTAVDLEKDGLVGSPEIVIPITFPPNVDALWTVWLYYVWTPNIPNIDVDHVTQAAFIPGIGSSLNSNYWELTNLYAVGKAQYDTVQLHRTADVGAGAFTPYHKAATNAFRPVEAGSELFSFYGDSFFKSELRHDETSFQQADQLMLDYKRFLRRHPQLTDNLKEAIWAELIQDFPVSIMQSGYMGVASLPKRKWADLQADETLKKSDSKSRDAMRQEHKHSTEWLKENGFCMDWIDSRPSTIPQAGRGAFASRFIPKGTRIALAPLIHIADPTKKIIDWCHDILKKEVVRNYSFGHRETSLLLTPHGAGISLINHAAEQSNVEIQWPSEELPCHKPLFLNLPVAALSHERTARLALEYVVTRNVYPGEELFLNYGKEWEAAWDRHIRRWRPQTEWFVHPSQVNKNDPIRTMAEVGYDPYPPNLYLSCQASYAPNDHGIYIHLSGTTETEWLPCQVISRVGYVYRVELETGIAIEQVPHNAIMFDTLPGMSDWALPDAFRHEMGLPDHLIPEVWKDKQPQSCK